MIFGADLRRDDGGSGVAGRPDSAGLADAGAGIRSGACGVTERFAADWLALREPFDHAARSVALARRLARSAAAGARGCVDLGGGTGSMFRFLAPIIGRGQDWILLDADAALLDEAFGRTAAWARRQGFAATAQGDELSVSTPTRAVAACRRVSAIWRRQFSTSPAAGEVAESVLTRGGSGHACSTPMRVCSALLDLVSAAWLARLRDALTRRSSPCLTVGWSRRLAAAPSARCAGAHRLPSRHAARQRFRPCTWRRRMPSRCVLRRAASRPHRRRATGTFRAPRCACSAR